MKDARADIASLLAALDPPVVIVTASAAGERSGCLVSFHAQLSMAPLRYGVWLSRANHTWPIARRATHLGVHLLGGRDHALARLFATTSGDVADKFSRCAWHAGPGAVPLLAGAAGWFVGTPVAWLDTDGDHAGVVLSPVAASAPPGLPAPLRYRDVRDLPPGHAPTEAPR